LGKDFSGHDFQTQFDFTKMSAFELRYCKTNRTSALFLKHLLIFLTTSQCMVDCCKNL